MAFFSVNDSSISLRRDGDQVRETMTVLRVNMMNRRRSVAIAIPCSHTFYPVTAISKIAMDNRETGDPQYGDRQHAFTLVHGFYATMGGFAFRALADDGTLSQRRAKFTAKGVRFLMKHEPNLIPDLSLTSITDRSDSGSLGNALLFIQATWFCLNCISRIRGRLPLAHLEVWTMAHGLCTLASYTAWWSKPRNIDAPTWISMDDEYAREAVALMQLLRLEGQTDHKRFQSAVENNYVLPQDFDTQILPLALRAAARYKLSPKDLQRKDDDPDYHITFDSTPRFEQLFWHVGLGRCLAGYGIVTCIPIFYGMSYLLGEDLAFPSIAEGRLWHKVTVGIMSSGAAVVTLFVARDVGCKMCSTVGQRKVITGYYDTVLYNLIPFFYVLGSIYLLTECIEQLRYMVSFAYVVTSWAYYFPHFY